MPSAPMGNDVDDEDENGNEYCDDVEDECCGVDLAMSMPLLLPKTPEGLKLFDDSMSGVVEEATAGICDAAVLPPAPSAPPQCMSCDDETMRRLSSWWDVDSCELRMKVLASPSGIRDRISTDCLVLDGLPSAPWEGGHNSDTSVGCR